MRVSFMLYEHYADKSWCT